MISPTAAHLLRTGSHKGVARMCGNLYGLAVVLETETWFTDKVVIFDSPNPLILAYHIQYIYIHNVYSKMVTLSVNHITYTVYIYIYIYIYIYTHTICDKLFVRGETVFFFFFKWAKSDMVVTLLLLTHCND